MNDRNENHENFGITVDDNKMTLKTNKATIEKTSKLQRNPTLEKPHSRKRNKVLRENDPLR